MKLVWTARALRDLEEIGEYIGADNPAAARKWIARLQSRARAAARVPGIGRRLPEYDNPFVREVLLRSYRVIYGVVPPHVVVLMVIEGHRQLPRRLPSSK